MYQDSNRVGAWLRVLEQKVEKSGNALLKDSGITVMQLRVLRYVRVHPEESQIADISEFFGVTHTSMVHVVNSLEEKKYVLREPIRRSRGKKIVLTENGRKLADENENRIECVEEALTDGFSEQDKAELLEMMKRMNSNLDRHFGRTQ